MTLFVKILIVVFVLASLGIEIWSGYFRAFLQSIKSFGLKPLRLIPFAATILFLTLALDPLIVKIIQNLTDQFPWIVTIGRTLGKNDNFWFTLAGLYSLGWLSRIEAFRKASFGMLLSSGFTALVVTIFKFVFLRARPTANLGHLSFFNLAGLTQDLSEFQSFPSGDVSLVAGAGLYLAFRLRNYWVRALLILMPISTAFARIHLNRHWPSDTLMSFMIAFFVTQILIHHEQSRGIRKAPNPKSKGSSPRY